MMRRIVLSVAIVFVGFNSHILTKQGDIKRHSTGLLFADGACGHKAHNKRSPREVLSEFNSHIENEFVGQSKFSVKT